MQLFKYFDELYVGTATLILFILKAIVIIVIKVNSIIQQFFIYNLNKFCEDNC